MPDGTTSRIIAQRILTGEFLDWDVPLRGAEHSRALSGPGGISGSLTPEMATIVADDGLPVFDRWSTALYVETDGQIANRGGLITDVETEGQTRKLTATGFTGYATGTPYMDDYMPTGFEDPMQVWRNIWSYVQSFPDSNLGLTVGPGSSWLRLSNGEGPYRINWFDNRDCGAELDSIAATVPFDYRETHEWVNATKTSIKHNVELGFPRLGSHRDDLLFEGGANVIGLETVKHASDQFANDVYLLGPGEGRAMLRSRAVRRDGRLRRVSVQSYKMGTQGFLDRKAKQELDARTAIADIAGFKIIDHPNARISAIQPGDDVLLRVEIPWEGDLSIWLRVLEIVESLERPGEATIKTTRSEFFSYAAATSPSGQPEVLIL